MTNKTEWTPLDGLESVREDTAGRLAVDRGNLRRAYEQVSLFEHAVEAGEEDLARIGRAAEALRVAFPEWRTKLEAEVEREREREPDAQVRP